MHVVALTLTVLVHFIGAGVLVWALLDGARSSWRDIWPRDDDGGGGPPRDEPPPRMPPPAFPEHYSLHCPAHGQGLSQLRPRSGLRP
jgi:hypothetical protein